MIQKKEDFEKLYSLNVNDKTEAKNGLTYLSWSWAWAEFKKFYPDAYYSVTLFDDGTGKQLPYMYDPNTGYMVLTQVAVADVAYEMWLPVMDGNNRAMKAEPYVVKTKYKEITVNAATMFDINKTIMRCLTKNLAMFGLGLYIFSGEDLPDTERAEEVVEQPKKKASKPKAEKKAEKTDEDLKAELKGLLMETESDTLAFLEWATKRYKRELKAVDEMHRVELEDAISVVGKKKGDK